MVKFLGSLVFRVCSVRHMGGELIVSEELRGVIGRILQT